MHWRRTTTTLNTEDLAFISEHNLSVAQLIRERCAQLRQESTAKLELLSAQKRIEGLQSQLHNRIRFISEKKLLEEFFAWEKQASSNTKS